MHCPRCGTSATPGQQFCRACGLSLEKVAEILSEEIAHQPHTPTEAQQLRERQKRVENWAGIRFWSQPTASPNAPPHFSKARRSLPAILTGNGKTLSNFPRLAAKIV